MSWLRALLAALLLLPGLARAEVSQVNVLLGAGGFGFLPLYLMQRHKLIEKHAAAAGVPVRVNWVELGGPAAANDAVLSGSADFAPAGPPGFLTLWDRTRTNARVLGVAAMSSMPMYLNTREPHLRTVDDLTGADKVAVTSVKISIPSIVMQMYARNRWGADSTFRFDPFTVTMAHPDAVTALLGRSGVVNAHFSSAPFHQREMREPGMRTILNTDDVMGGSTTFTMVFTTTRFHDANPRVFAAFVAAMKEAQAMIAADRPAAAQVLLDAMGGRGFTLAELVAILDDPVTKYVPAPENVLKYAAFMHGIGSLRNNPATIGELFFPDAGVGEGN